MNYFDHTSISYLENLLQLIILHLFPLINQVQSLSHINTHSPSDRIPIPKAYCLSCLNCWINYIYINKNIQLLSTNHQIIKYFIVLNEFELFNEFIQLLFFASNSLKFQLFQSCYSSVIRKIFYIYLSI